MFGTVGQQVYRDGKTMWDNLVNVPLGIDRKPLFFLNSNTVFMQSKNWTFISPTHRTDEGFQVEGQLHVCATLYQGLELGRHRADENNPGVTE